MSEFKNTQLSGSEEAVFDSGLQPEAIPSEYPTLPEEVMGELGSTGIGRHARPLMNGERDVLKANWATEQKLAAINDGREQGTLTPEAADALELDVLRRLRESIFSMGVAVPMAKVHDAMERRGAAHLNVSRPRRW